MSIYFISDTHFGHTNIIRYSNRPFKHTDEMNETIISNWNAIVKPQDIVYHLGDFAFLPEHKAENILRRLNGHKHFILGNHDKNNTKLKGWTSIQHYKEIQIGEDSIVLFHYGMRVWNKSHYGSYMLYGHSHGSLPGNSQSLDVGVDCWNFTPIDFDQIRERMKTLPEFTNRHHKEDRHV